MIRKILQALGLVKPCLCNTVNANITFKEQIEQIITPAIKLMLEKEHKHLQWLKKQDQSNIHVLAYTLKSEYILEQLEKRLDEYIKYADGL
jgi:hypothetical protein